MKDIGQRLSLELQCGYQGQQGDVSQSVRGNYKTRFICYKYVTRYIYVIYAIYMFDVKRVIFICTCLRTFFICFVQVMSADSST